MNKIILITLLIISCSPEESEYVFPVQKLPKITIETEDIKEIDSKENYIDGTFKFVSNDYDFDDFEKHIVIRGRGNSTWQMPKKSYKFKFDEKFSLFNLPEDKKWITLANYSDKTMLRNALAFELGYMSVLEWTPEFHFAELQINGNEKGLYQFMDKVET